MLNISKSLTLLSKFGISMDQKAFFTVPFQLKEKKSLCPPQDCIANIKSSYCSLYEIKGAPCTVNIFMASQKAFTTLLINSHPSLGILR